MKTGIYWNVFGSGALSDDEQIELLHKNGFEATFTDSWQEGLPALVKRLCSEGITCESCHAPFKGINSMWLAGDDGEKMTDILIGSAENCAGAGVPVLVCHLSSGDDAPRISDIGCERFGRLVERAASLGVKIAFENQRKLANLAFAMEEYPGAGFCWDAGHEACFAYGREYMPLFSSRLAAIHLHDNFGEHNKDLHMLPFDAGLDFERITMRLAESGYEGAIMLETFVKSKGAYEGVTPEQYYKKAGEAAKKLAAMTESKRSAQ